MLVGSYVYVRVREVPPLGMCKCIAAKNKRVPVGVFASQPARANRLRSLQ